ncbi:response regulator transcription factor [Paenibacillus dokdonensis]|uniref:response regulator transcription factor n=1 Tax=Paenibacillus dokdonensis TaxID=2567944 RepID=UPI0010A8689D|nr:response regulator transcription factor [Paenibacillus dokdonensis]
MMTNHRRVLLVDDETRIRTILRMYLELEGFIVEEAPSGTQAIQRYGENHENYDLIVLDWLLPDLNGIEVCKCMKQTQPDIPILMLSGRSEERDRIEGFEAGADDYVIKPFSPREIVLRIQNMITRVYSPSSYVSETDNLLNNAIMIGEIVLYPSARRVMVKQNDVHLTPKEYDLLYFLITHQETVYSREILLTEVWKSSHREIYEQRTVDAHIKRLREKLFSYYPEGKECIQTLWGRGYMFHKL